MTHNALHFWRILFPLLLISSIGSTLYPVHKFTSCVEPNLSFMERAMVYMGVMEKPRVCQPLESFLVEMARVLLLHLVYLILVFWYYKTSARTSIRKECDTMSAEEKERISEFQKLQEAFREHEMEVLRDALPFRNNHVIDIDGADALIPVMCVDPEELLKPDEWVNQEL